MLEQPRTIDEELGDLRSAAVDKMLLGDLARLHGNLLEAAQCLYEAVTAFQQLNEPVLKAQACHLLGMVYQEDKQWDAAEQVYREAARIYEFLGNQLMATQSWHHLGIVNREAGKPEIAEAFYRKAIEAGIAQGDKLGVCKRLNNFADLLQH